PAARAPGRRQPRAIEKDAASPRLGESVSPVSVIICGAKGRMGRALVSAASGDPELHLAGEVDQGDDLTKVIVAGDVVIDFSVREATAAVAKIAADHRKALVIGTTGHSD